MEAQVVNKINYHTNQLKKSFRLNSHDVDDVRQELTLAALEAERTNNPNATASLVTFLKLVIERKAAMICRELKKLPIMENHEDGGGIEGAGVRNHNFQRTAEITDELNDTNYPPKIETKKTKIKPTVATIGVNLQHITESRSENDQGAKMDVQVVLARLKPRQRKICKMLMAGNTQEEIAEEMHISQPYVNKQIKNLRGVFTDISQLT